MNRIFVLLFALFVPLCIQAQKNFEGLIKYDIKYPESIPGMESMLPKSTETIVSQKRGLTRMQGGLQADMLGDVLTDYSNGKVHFILHSSKVIYSTTEDKMPKQDEVKPTIKKGKGKMRIMGYDCVPYTVEIKVNDMVVNSTFWTTTQFEPARQPNTVGMSTPNVKVEGFPMKIETSVPIPGMGSFKMEMTVTQLKVLNELPNNVLSLPAGYTQKEGLPPVFQMGN